MAFLFWVASKFVQTGAFYSFNFYFLIFCSAAKGGWFMNILIIANSESVHTARYANDFVERGHQVSLLSVMPYLNQSVVYHKNVKHISFMPFTTNLLKRLFGKSFMSFSAEHSKPYHIMNFLIMARLIYMVLFVNRELRNTPIDSVFGMNLTVYGLLFKGI